MRTPPRIVAVHTRARANGTVEALRRVVELGLDAGLQVLVSPEDRVHAQALQGLDGAIYEADAEAPTDLALVLGGDGTILSALRRYAGRGVPVFAFNFGAIGFLSTVERTDLEEGMRRALSGDFEVLALPALAAETEGGEQLAINDMSFHRRPHARVAELAYSVAGEKLGEVRCDGLVVSTPAGSTGYNLANGGPVLAWGVEGYVVSFIAPHTLTARSLVVAPGDALDVANVATRGDAVDMTTDGRVACELPPGSRIRVRFREGGTLLAQQPGATFYKRLREKFGRLAY